MKKIITILLTSLLLISLFSCESNPNDNDNNNKETTTTTGTTTAPATEPNEDTEPEVTEPNPEDDIDVSNITIDSSLSDIMKKVYHGVEAPMTFESEITADNVAYFLGLEYTSMYTEALSSDATISAIPHSVCLVKVSDGQDVGEVKSLIEENANPSKWICAIADKVIVDSVDNVVILIMATEEIADALHSNFMDLA